MVTIFGDDSFYFSIFFLEIFLGRKGSKIKGYHRENKKNNQL